MKKLFKNLKIKRRAIAKLAALHFYGNPSVKLKIVGVTGTNGKTTTATLLYKIATELGYKTGLISTVENIIGTEKRHATHTTPGPIPLNKLLKEMVEKDCEYVFMEVSSHAMDQKRVAGVSFVGGVFTNLTHDHLDYHKSFENYFLAKKKFFNFLPKTSFALSNGDDEHGKAIIDGIKAKQYLYGFNGMENFHGEIFKLDFSGLGLDVNGNKINSRLLGKFNANNLLAIWSTCKLLGFDTDKVNKILENIEPPRGRFDHFLSKNGVLAIVDYAHTPDALEKVLLAIKEIKKENGKIISVFGCGGDRDPLKRRIMGKIGTSLSDIAIITSDNPRSEDPEKIINEMKVDLTMNDLKKVKTISDRRGAIKEAIKLAQAGDIILCAGKGHEEYQEIKGVKHHFNDMEELKKNLL
ncbi:UDP-N-acetylmuramoyl-L-alanyl-D-glutamate--2,6-diaminopimelate ligase [Patescibacteria group bacterium]|nr:UDP-N-acetylmuramoyl-L-alanyl-D-glutamate--2,6-diaminopimelate ligase [Patescibacteria group bacterium]